MLTAEAGVNNTTSTRGSRVALWLLVAVVTATRVATRAIAERRRGPHVRRDALRINGSG